MLYVKEIELKFRKRPAIGIEGASIVTPEDAYGLVQDIRNSVVEKLIALHLNGRNILNCVQVVSIGSVNSAPVSPAEIARVSLLTGSVGVIMVHNHPSGGTEPSEGDRITTGRVKKTLALLEINLLDHIIVADSGFYSFKTSGILHC